MWKNLILGKLSKWKDHASLAQTGGHLSQLYAQSSRSFSFVPCLIPRPYWQNLLLQEIDRNTMGAFLIGSTWMSILLTEWVITPFIRPSKVPIKKGLF